MKMYREWILIAAVALLTSCFSLFVHKFRNMNQAQTWTKNILKLDKTRSKGQVTEQDRP